MIIKVRNYFLIAASLLMLVGCGSIMQTGKLAEVAKSRDDLTASLESPKNIVLMLPLKGDLAKSSEAIRNGFLAAYYQSHKLDDNDINIKVVDTTSGDIRTLYQQVISDGADIVVGPLTKKELESLLKMPSFPVPTVALNTLENYEYNYAPNLYQFGLMPQDEVQQSAIKMLQNHYKKVAVIAPDTAWGDRMSTIFKNRLAMSGGEVVATLKYNSTKSFSSQVCNFLVQDPDEICGYKKREDRKKDLIGEDVLRQDIDSIFMLASPKDARQLVPLLKFYYAGELPVYSTSMVFSGNSKPFLDQDINGVYFCDMPWVLKNHNSLNGGLKEMYLKIKDLWPSSLAKYKRLYALGIDAYEIASKFSDFLNDSNVGVNGASGVLYLDQYNHIYRDLEWVRIRSGVPTAVRSYF